MYNKQKTLGNIMLDILTSSIILFIVLMSITAMWSTLIIKIGAFDEQSPAIISEFSPDSIQAIPPVQEQTVEIEEPAESSINVPVVESHMFVPVVDVEPVIPPNYHYQQVDRTFNVMENQSGLTVEQLEILLEEYPGLADIADNVIGIEEEHGVNAFYTLAVASLESGYGTSKMAKNWNNLFGMMNCKFDSTSSGVDYFGRLMTKYQDSYNILMTVEGINPTYCELDSWAGKIVELMNQWIRKANDKF